MQNFCISETPDNTASPLSALHKEPFDMIKERVDTDDLNSIEGSVFEDSLELFNHMKVRTSRTTTFQKFT